MKLTQKQLLVGSVLLGAGALWIVSRGGLRGAASSAVGAAGSVAAGTVEGVASLFGVPQTDMAKCQRDLAAGNYLEASFSCPAGTYIPKMAGAATNAATAGVIGVSKVFGIPETNATQCQRDMAAGDWWAASFSCPAGTFIKNSLGAMSDTVFGSTVISTAAANEEQRMGGASGGW